MQGATTGTMPQVLPPGIIPTVPQAPIMPTSRGLMSQTPQPKSLDPGQLVTIFNHVTDERLVQEIGCVYQFNISGEGGIWYLDLRNGNGHAGKGPPFGCKPDAVISLSSEDMQALFSGELSAFDGYMQGKVTVEGDVRMAMKLQTVVERMKHSRLTTKTAHVHNDVTNAATPMYGRDDVMII